MSCGGYGLEVSTAVRTALRRCSREYGPVNKTGALPSAGTWGSVRPPSNRGGPQNSASRSRQPPQQPTANLRELRREGRSSPHSQRSPRQASDRWRPSVSVSMTVRQPMKRSSCWTYPRIRTNESVMMAVLLSQTKPLKARISGYVQQDDLFIGCPTVIETL